MNIGLKQIETFMVLYTEDIGMFNIGQVLNVHTLYRQNNG